MASSDGEEVQEHYPLYAYSNWEESHRDGGATLVSREQASRTPAVHGCSGPSAEMGVDS